MHSPNPESVGDKVVKTLCNMCLTNCGINVHVKEGKIIKVERMEEHPIKMPSTKICVKPEGMIEWVYSKERVLSPLKKVNGQFEEISWDEAFSFIADELSRIKQEYGARALLFHLGTPFIASQTEKVARRFSDFFGTPNFTTGSTYCFYARAMVYSLTLGTSVTASLKGTNCIIVWGTNPPETTPLQGVGIREMKKGGAKLIVIDPRRTPLAKEADIHAQIRPGSDCALALGLLHVIINEKLYDEDFVKNWTVGFDKLVKHVQVYTPQRVEELTWVPAEMIVNIAHLYSTSGPAAISPGIALEHCTNGIQTLRAIAILIAITGNFDVEGGNSYVSRLKQTWLRGEKVSEESIGAEFPLFEQIVTEPTATRATEIILSEKPYPIKALIIQGSNPMLTWPNTNKVKRAFEKLDLLVVIDVMMTDTAKVADIVLPVCTFLEREDLRDGYRQAGLPLFGVTNRVIEPLGNSIEDWKIWAELAKRMGYGEYFPWQDTDELFRYLLEPSGYSLEQLKEKPEGIFHSKKEFQRYLESGFNTPSGKVEIYSETMERHGYDPLPTFVEPMESPISKPALAKEYPLTLITGPRVNCFFHTQFHNVPPLRKFVPEPLLDINTKTAGLLGISDGDMVKVESQRGSLKLRAKTTDDIDPRVISMPHAWSEANANLLTIDTECDPVSGFPGFKSVLCRGAKAK